MVTKRELQFTPFSGQVEYIDDMKFSNMKYTHYGGQNRHYSTDYVKYDQYFNPSDQGASHRTNILLSQVGTLSNETPQIFALPNPNHNHNTYNEQPQFTSRLLNTLPSHQSQSQLQSQSYISTSSILTSHISFDSFLPENTLDWTNKSIWNKGNEGNNIW